MRELKNFIQEQKHRAKEAALELIENELVSDLPFTQQKTLNQLARRFFRNFPEYPGDDHVHLSSSLMLTENIMLGMWINLDDKTLDISKDLQGIPFRVGEKNCIISDPMMERLDIPIYLHDKNEKGQIIHAKAKLTIGMYRVCELSQIGSSKKFSDLFSPYGKLRKEGRGNSDLPYPFSSCRPVWTPSSESRFLREKSFGRWSEETKTHLLDALVKSLGGGIL